MILRVVLLYLFPVVFLTTFINSTEQILYFGF